MEEQYIPILVGVMIFIAFWGGVLMNRKFPF